MRLLRNCSPILLIALLLPLAAMGADRVVLFESYTNTACPYCPNDNAVLAEVVEDYGTTEPIQMINVQYHVSWPSSADPFYAANIADNTAATLYYDINAVPDLRTDGADQPARADSVHVVVDYMNDRLTVPSPMTIDVSHYINESCELVVEATVEADAALPTSGLVVRMALVEESTHYDTAPGSNGQTDFYCTMRKMLPDFNGTPLTITSAGQSQVVTHSASIEPGWRMIYAVVWVQDTSNDEVLQAGRSWPSDPTYWEDYTLAYNATQAADFYAVGETKPLGSMLQNTGLYADTYDVHLDKSGLPLGWEASVCIGATCYPPFVTDFVVDLEVLATMEILVDVTANSEGQGTATIEVSGRGNPCVSAGSVDLIAVTAGADVLLVDADGGYPWENYYETSLTAAGKTFTHWDLNGWGRLSAEQLGFFDTVIWSTAKTYGADVVNDEDRAAIGGYLDGGGNIFVSGQMIGYSTTNYGTAGEEWHQTYMGSEYDRYGNYEAVNGMAGDEISDGLALAIIGGDGANNQTYPSKIDAFGDGIVIFEYDGNPFPTGGVRINNDTFKTVYLPWSFEAISSQVNRDLLMGRILDYLGPDGSPVPEYAGGKAFMATAPLPTPNPFNPSTQIKFEMGGNLAGQVKIEVFDIRGCLVRSLFEGMVQPGPQSFEWDGRSNLGSEVASGTYMGLVQVGLDKKMVKMVLAK